MTRTSLLLALTAFAVAAPLQAQRFEAPKQIDRELDGIRIDLGASFTQAFQSLNHSNAAAPNIGTDGADANLLADIGAGFNLATANIDLRAQLTPGIRVELETYLSSRHHNEAWVKGGFLQIDESPIDVAALDKVMEYLTIKIGHYGVNYGDAHYRRTDNGNAIHNPFAENLILDAFTTEIGGEVIARAGSFLAVAGLTSGQNKGDVTAPDGRSWAYVGKLGFDHSFSDDMRVRLTGSTYQNDNAGRATLYGGDRAGSAYWGVMDNSKGAVFTNGRVNPNFTEEIQAYQINPFVQIGGVELFGVAEFAQGRTLQEQTAGLEKRDIRQYAVDGLYRFLDDRLYVGARYNTVTGELYTVGTEESVDRTVLGGGWFLSDHILLKGEYVTQKYRDFADTNVLHGGKFDGVIFQGVVSF